VFKSYVRGQTPSDDAVIPNSVYLHTYIIYLRQTYTVERNLLMIETLRASKQGDGKKNRPQDFARLYEIIVQVCVDNQLHRLCVILLELYYCHMVEWFWWDSTNWFLSVL